MPIHFITRKQGKTDPVIVLQVFDGRFKGRKFMYSSGINISASLWDKRKGRAKVIPAKENELNELNKHLDKLEHSVIDFLSTRHNSKTLSREDLKAHINKSKLDERKTQEDQLQKESNFFSIWENIIETTKNPKTGEKITGGTKRSKTQTKNLVAEFCTAKRITPTLENIDMNFYYAFEQYMTEREIPLQPNTRGKHVKELKAILRECVDRDYKVNPAYMKKSFKVIRKEVDNIYLNEEQLRGLIDDPELDENLSPAELRQRDIFVAACYVGARHSDWHQIRQANIEKIEGRELLKITQRKTGDVIHIPLHPIVKRILKKYKGELPKVISNQKFNSELKDIGKKAKLKDKDGLTTHTARRSFCTNAYLSGMDVHQIMRFSGHKSESSFLKYLKLGGRDYAMKASDSKFFSLSWEPKMKIA